MQQKLTTIMAIFPPTSPTTFIGGFSFRFSTKKNKIYIKTIL